LQRRIEESLEIDAEQSTRRDELEGLRHNIARLEEHLGELVRLAGTMQSRLMDLGHGDLSRGIDRLLQSRVSHREARLLGQALVSEGIDVDGTSEVAVHSPDAGTASGRLDALKRDLAVVEEARLQTREEEIGLREEVARLGVHRGVPEVEGDLEAVEIELASVRRLHDRLRLVEGIIRLADQRFRERHQPDVIARTNAYLKLITDGRYRGIVLDEGTRRLNIISAADSRQRPLDVAVSQGTRDQVYLSLRLALADHMDSEHEPLPIFLDEVFVTWDKERRHRAYPILAELSKRRQIFLLTCHRWFEEEALVHLGAHVVHIERASQAV
jgi:uncharacterized protein YhaN